jgi:hypothetical protein
MVTFTEEITLTKMECPVCGIPYALTERYRSKKNETGDSWVCPNGHSLSYSDSEVKRLKRELEAKTLEANRNREQYFAEQRKHEQTQKAMTRLKKRTAAGVCPCCQRTFQQLSRHMKTKHIEFVKEHGIPVAEPEKVA